MKNKGFTLVELIVVIAVLSLLMMIGVPAFAQIVERMQVRADKASANEIGEAIKIRELDVPAEKRVEYYPVITRYDQLEGIDEYISPNHRPQSMKEGYYFVTALNIDGIKKILVGIGKEDMPVTDTAYTSPRYAGWVYIEGGEISGFLASNNEMLEEPVVMPDDYPKSSGVSSNRPINSPSASLASLKIGEYVRYEPTTPSYSVTSGTKTSTFYPVNSKSWKIFSIDGDTITLISAGTVGNLALEGKDGYINGVGILNSIASKYIDNNYAVSARSIGSSAESVLSINEDDNPLTWNETYNKGKNGSPYKDTFHKADRDIIRENKSLQLDSDVWFASRYIFPTDSHTYFSVRSIGANNTDGAQSLYIDRKNGTSASLEAPSLGVRVIIQLASGVKVNSGTGTLTDPYILSK